MTKVVVLSDTHNQHMQIKDIPDGDILIHCGDATVYGKKDELEDFLSWFSWQPHKYKIFVPGNHDEGLFYDGQQPLFKEVSIPEEIIYLEEKYIEIEGLKIYGSPCKPRPDWALQHKPGVFAAFGVLKSKIKERWDKIPNNLDILITHVPPYGILDNTGFKHYGCPDLLAAVAEKIPRVHCFGHVHDRYGILMAEDQKTTFVNAALCDELYDLNRGPITMEL